ncbi:hypothetical protein MKEN_01161700 [Mycena kentingensis (nom. inval.)]|nr:hypothetical protein MKEN_01161700 [Mycena kentingensis (nom. inval.)]
MTTTNENLFTQPFRVEELWFTDGNIVLTAGNAQYKVYRGILAKQSTVFADMLSLPLPPDGDEQVDGCPAVTLHDAEVEVTPFLKALFDASFFQAFPTETDFTTIYGCLRLAHKYDVDFLRQRALVHFSSVYPMTLKGYQDGTSFASLGDRMLSSVCSWEIPEDDEAVLCALQLAREVGATWTLPIIFYELGESFFRLGHKIFSGVVYEGVRAQIGQDDATTLIHGLHAQIAQGAVVMRFLCHSDEVSDCPSPLACLRRRLYTAETMRALNENYLSQPLVLWAPDDWDQMEDQCAACLAELKLQHATALEAFWEELPSMYDLPPWKDLEEMKRAAIGQHQSDSENEQDS